MRVVKKVFQTILLVIVSFVAFIVFFLRDPLMDALYGKPIPRLEMEVAVIDPLAAGGLEGYRRYRDAVSAGELEVLAELSSADDSYLAYRSALTLARSPELTAAERLPHYLRVQQLRIDDPLARAENRAFLLEVARTAEAAGDSDTAISNFAAALPASEAVEALERLVSDPYRLAGLYLNARLNSAALAALDGLAAPSIEAPAHRALGQHEQALDAYERWLLEVPDSSEALSGRAWSNFYLGNNETADAQFAELSGSNALYGRGLLANRAGDLDAAARFLDASGDPYHLWLATDLLERAGRTGDAMRFYLRLAEGSSAYAEQAAYRALVLAERSGDSAAAAKARALIPAGSFYDLVLGGTLELPATSTEPAADAAPEAVELAHSLARALDEDAATGELLFALRASDDAGERLELSSTLQAFGEYRHSRVAAQELLSVFPDDRRVWRLAWPEAFPDAVRDAAAQTGTEPELIWAVMRQESAFYPLAVSTSDARGLMQVIPSTWDWLAELQREQPADMFDVHANVRYGAFYLDWLLNYFDGDLQFAVASYNRGQGYIRRLFEGEEVAGDRSEWYRQIDAQETRNYLERVLYNYHVYLGLSDDLDVVSSVVSRETSAVAD